MSLRVGALIALEILLAISCDACASATAHPPTVAPTAVAPAPAQNSTVPQTATAAAAPILPTVSPVTAPRADIVLTPANQQQTSRVKVGQVIHVPAMPEFEWSVSYRPEVLLALTPPDKLGNPGAAGWLFRVIAPGNTTIVLTSSAPPCLGGTPCPPNIVRLEFPIEAIP